MRIFKQNRDVFSLKELNSLKSFMFNSPWLNSNERNFISRFTPIIFDLTEDNLSIEAQFNTYNDAAVWPNIERLYEMTFPFYEYWFIQCLDNFSRDSVASFKRLHQLEKGSPDTEISKWEACRYNFDKVSITCLEVPASLQHITWKKVNQSTFESINYKGQYFSNSIKSFTKGSNYCLTPDDGDIIPLKNKYDREVGGIIHQWVEGEWYSDGLLLNFLQNELKKSTVEQIEFFFNGRTTRIIEKFSYDQILCFDGWDNCGDAEFLQYLQERM